jgi:DNA-binding NarL/FixJ family response regulator
MPVPSLKPAINTRFRREARVQDTSDVDELGAREREVALLAAEGASVFSAMNRVQNTSLFNLLSVRERQVMLLAAKGLANKLIARELHIAEGTVKLHLHRVYQKLGIKGRFALAVRTGNLSLPETRTLTPFVNLTLKGALSRR